MQPTDRQAFYFLSPLFPPRTAGKVSIISASKYTTSSVPIPGMTRQSTEWGGEETQRQSGSLKPKLSFLWLVTWQRWEATWERHKWYLSIITPLIIVTSNAYLYFILESCCQQLNQAVQCNGSISELLNENQEINVSSWTYVLFLASCLSYAFKLLMPS